MEVFESLLPVTRIFSGGITCFFYCNCHSSGCRFSQLWRLCPSPTHVIKEESNNWDQQWQRSLFWHLWWHLWWYQVMAGSLNSVSRPLRVCRGFLLCCTSCASLSGAIKKCDTFWVFHLWAITTITVVCWCVIFIGGHTTRDTSGLQMQPQRDSDAELGRRSVRHSSCPFPIYCQSYLLTPNNIIIDNR